MKTFSPATRRIGFSLTGLTVLAVIVAAVAQIDTSHSASGAPAKTDTLRSAPVRFTSNGELTQPTGYRKWPYVGTPLTPHDMNDGKAAFPEFHNVYIDPAAEARI